MAPGTNDFSQGSTLTPFRAGLALASSTFFTIYLVLWLFTLFFQQSLSGISLLMVIVLLPCLLALIPLLRLPARWQHFFQVVSGYIIVPLICILGLVVQFDFNKDSILTMGLIDAIVLLGVYNAQLDFNGILRLSVGNGTPQLRAKGLFLLGSGIAFLAAAHAIMMAQSMTLVSFSAAALYAVRSLVLSNSLPVESLKKEENGRVPTRKWRVDLWLGFAARWLVFALHSILVMYITSERGLALWAQWLFGVAIGTFSMAGLRVRSIPIHAITAVGGLMLETVLLWLDWTLFLTWPMMLLNGFLVGITWCWILDDLGRKAASSPPLPLSHKFGQAFWMVASRGKRHRCSRRCGRGTAISGMEAHN